MLILGANLPGRFTEQHDVFFGIGRHLSDLIPAIKGFWPEAGDKIHIDSYRQVNKVDSYSIEVVPRTNKKENALNLYFLNLGGYKPQDMEEYHYKVLVVADSMAKAIQIAKDSIFYKHYDSSHVDDKYAVDVDDVYAVEDMLSADYKEQYALNILSTNGHQAEDQLVVGYLKLSKIVSE